MIETITYIISNIGVAWPSIIMGAVVPMVVLLALFFSKKRKSVPFVTVFYGFGTFLLVLVGVAILTLLLSNAFMPSISVSNVEEADQYIYIGGILVLLSFYAGSEIIRMLTFKSCVNTEKNEGVGLTYGSGFILAQNLLILGLASSAKLDYTQSVAFGILMIISGIVYILNSAIGYQLVLTGHQWIGFSAAASYYLLFAVMILFANIYVTYTFVFLVLLFNAVVGYKLLPLPFKKKGREE